LEEKSLTEQGETLRAGLTGLSEEDRALLDKGKVFDAADRAVQSWQAGINSFQEGAASLKSTINSYLTHLEAPPTEPEEQILKAAHKEYRMLLGDAKASLEALTKRAEAFTAPATAMDANSPWRQWSEKMAAFRALYEAAVQHSSAHSEKLKQLKDIEEQLNNHVRETARVREELRALAAAEGGYRTERTAWEALLKERDDLLDTQCKALTESSQGAIRAVVKRHADSVDFVNGLRQSLSGSRIQGTKIEALGGSITAASDAGTQWNALLSDLETLAEFDAGNACTVCRWCNGRRPGSDSPKPEAGGLASAVAHAD
jgi:chromosome segregation protein